MCGRTACTLAPDQVCKACSYPSKKNASKNTFSQPQWRDHPGSHTYSPSTNLAPSMYCPVLIKDTSLPSHMKRDFEGNEKTETSTYIVQPMRWGFIPSFFKGDSPKEFGLKTSNCRIEGMEEKKMYKASLNKGMRCVVLSEGFYEWQSTKGNKNKQPYFIHAPQPEGVQVWDKENWVKEELWNEEKGWAGAQLLKMAGLYSRWTSTQGEEIYSFTIITMESEENFSWLHHRVPAILETFEDVQKWLEEEDYKKALSVLRKCVSLSSYPVSTLVNNTKNRDRDLFLPISLDEKKPPESGESKMMAAWLSAPSKKSTRDQFKSEPKLEEKPKGIMKWLKKAE